MTTQEKLIDIAKQLGLKTDTATARRPNWMVGNINGYKFEIEYRTKWELIIDYHEFGLAQELKEHYDCFRNVRGARVFFQTPEELLAFSLEIKQYIADHDLVGEWEQSRSRKTDDAGYFEKTATILEMAVKLEHWDFIDRGSCGFDAHDELITIGRSKAWEAAKAANPDYVGYREHIVPCVMIREEFIRMVGEGAAIVELAQMLKSNLAIVMITNEEAAHIDGTYKTTMPEGWNFGDPITARLDVMGVAY